MCTVLILGGTSEARACASALLARGFDVVSSLAGRVSAPRLPDGAVRIGGFGGPDGLRRWLSEHDVRAVVDATHPFAERIGASAVAATRESGVPLVRLQRPGWREGPGEQWTWVDSLDEAAALLPSLGSHAFVTTGRQGLMAFTGAGGVRLLVRCVDPPEVPLPADAEVRLDRGPYTVESERELMRRYGIDVLVTKDSGAAMTRAKLTAAGELGVAVVVVRRPLRAVTETAHTAEDALHWVVRQVRRQG